MITDVDFTRLLFTFSTAYRLGRVILRPNRPAVIFGLGAAPLGTDSRLELTMSGKSGILRCFKSIT